MSTSVTECTTENAAEFNARLREYMPDFHALAAALHRRGMIDGLRNARIAPLPEGLPRSPGAVQPTFRAASEARHLDREWVRKQGRGR